MVFDPIRSQSQFWKDAQILRTCGDQLCTPTISFQDHFSQPQSVYIRFTHIGNMQPKFYIGSAMHHTLDREYSRSRKYLQLTNERLVQAELALRYWRDHDNLYIWAPIPIYTDRADYRSLDMAIIQEWQPRLNYPFICQFSDFSQTLWTAHTQQITCHITKSSILTNFKQPSRVRSSIAKANTPHHHILSLFVLPSH